LIKLIGSIAAAAAVLAVLFTGIEPLRNLFFSGTKITVPDVGGMAEREAVNTINSLGLRANPEPRFSQDRVGTVINQNPPAGTRIAKGREVRLAVAARPLDLDVVTVPNVVRQPLDRAVQMLTEAGLEPGTVTNREIAAAQAGTVLNQRIRAGSRVPRGTRVDLLLGRESVTEGGTTGDTSSTTQPTRLLARRSLEIPQTWSFDLDSGKVGQNGDADLWFESPTATERYLTPRNGATIGLSRIDEACPTVRMTAQRLPIERIPTAGYVCVRTNSGHLAALRLREPVGPSPGVLKIDYMLWE
jgi:hypothetical protein